MATIISDELVEMTWQEVAQMEPEDAQTAMQAVAKQQPVLLAHVMASTDGLRDEAQELAIYVFFVIQKIFEGAAEGPLEEVSITKVEEHADRNDALLERLSGAHDRFLARVTAVETARQPFVYRYLSEVLIEEGEQDPELELTEEESGLLFITLKTVIDALDEALDA
jgi:hypothetical protein